jgi:hypothetical protein
MAGCSEHFIQSPFTANRHPDHTSYKKYKDVFDERANNLFQNLTARLDVQS